MNLINEQNIVRLEIGEDRCEVARFFEYRARGLTQVHTHFVGNDVRQCCLAQARWPEDQHVIQRFSALPGRGDEIRICCLTLG